MVGDISAHRVLLQKTVRRNGTQPHRLILMAPALDLSSMFPTQWTTRCWAIRTTGSSHDGHDNKPPVMGGRSPSRQPNGEATTLTPWPARRRRRSTRTPATCDAAGAAPAGQIDGSGSGLHVRYSGGASSTTGRSSRACRTPTASAPNLQRSGGLTQHETASTE